MLLLVVLILLSSLLVVGPASIILVMTLTTVSLVTSIVAVELRAILLLLVASVLPGLSWLTLMSPLSAGVLMVLSGSIWLIHGIPLVLVLNFVTQIIILAILGSIDTFFFSIFFLALLFALFVVGLGAHIFLARLLLVTRMVMMVTCGLLAGSVLLITLGHLLLGLIPFFFDEVVHCHNLLMAIYFRVLLILALMELLVHRLIIRVELIPVCTVLLILLHLVALGDCLRLHHLLASFEVIAIVSSILSLKLMDDLDSLRDVKLGLDHIRVATILECCVVAMHFVALVRLIEVLTLFLVAHLLLRLFMLGCCV